MENRYNKLMLLCGNEKFGGAERRFARSFVYVSKYDKNIYLLINEALYNGLVINNIPVNKSNNVIIIKKNQFFPTLLYKFLFIYQVVKKSNQLIKKHNIKIIHFAFSWQFINVLLLKKKMIKIISIVDPDLDSEMKGFFKRKIFRYIVKKCDFIDFLSEEIKNKLYERHPECYKESKTHISPCSFIDYTNYYPSDKKENSIIALSRLVKWKNPELFLNAIPIILENIKLQSNDIKFYIIGDGPLKETLEKKAHELKVNSKVIFAFALKPYEFLNKSKIFVSLQNENNYPSQSLIEAMACGNAVVATDVGETWKLVDEKTGIRVKPDSKDIADAVVYLLNNPEILEQFGRNARDKVLKDHTIERFTDYLSNELYAR